MQVPIESLNKISNPTKGQTVLSRPSCLSNCVQFFSWRALLLEKTAVRLILKCSKCYLSYLLVMEAILASSAHMCSVQPKKHFQWWTWNFCDPTGKHNILLGGILINCFTLKTWRHPCHCLFCRPLFPSNASIVLSRGWNKESD